MAPGIQVEGAQLIYEQHLIFKDLNLTISPAQSTCLLGPSGVGKSSLLRLIAGLNSYASSKAIIATDNLPLANRIAYMAQQDSLLPWLSVIDNVIIGMRLRGNTVNRSDIERAKTLLTKLGLEKFFNSTPGQLSGGMKQRVVLARTVFERRSIILMDEPFAALDVITRAYIQELAAEFLRDKTVLLVTHDPMEALRLGHHVYIMSGAPATISTEISLPGLPPRQLTDPLLLETHAELLQKLSHAREVTVCS